MPDATPDLDRIVAVSRKLSRPYRVDAGDGFKLKNIDPADTAGLGDEDKPRAKDCT